MSFYDANKRLLAIASFGGHWVQLMRLKKSFVDFDVHYVSTAEDQPSELKGSDNYHLVDDVSADSGFAQIFKSIYKAFILLYKMRPAVVVSTGALPGLIFLVISKILFRSKTVWVDSIANSEKISFSGRVARYFSDIYLTQWEHLAGDGKLKFIGRVI